MKLEKQVCNYYQAKRLKELGIAQNESQFYWYMAHINTVPTLQLRPMWIEDCGMMVRYSPLMRALTGESKNEVYAAFTVAEMGVMLPAWHFTYNQSIGTFLPQTVDQGYFSNISGLGSEIYNTEAEARAAILVHLLGSGKANPEGINSRLNNA